MIVVDVGVACSAAHCATGSSTTAKPVPTADHHEHHAGDDCGECHHDHRDRHCLGERRTRTLGHSPSDPSGQPVVGEHPTDGASTDVGIVEVRRRAASDADTRQSACATPIAMTTTATLTSGPPLELVGDRHLHGHRCR